MRAGIDPKGHTVVDASGLLILPGGIDAHTHLDMPFGGTTSADDFETGTRAAAIGGTTTIVDFAIQPKGTKMRAALDTWWKKAEGKACIDYGLHMVVTDLGMKSPAAGGRPLHAYTVINNAGKIPSTLFLDGGRLSEVDNADGSSVKFSKFDAPVDIEPPM